MEIEGKGGWIIGGGGGGGGGGGAGPTCPPPPSSYAYAHVRSKCIQRIRHALPHGVTNVNNAD